MQKVVGSSLAALVPLLPGSKRRKRCTTVETMRNLPITALVALTLAGCGDSSGRSTDATAVRTAVNRWTEAVVRHDSRAACAQLSSSLRKQLERHLLGEGVSGNCRSWAGRWVSPRHPAADR